LNNEGKIDKEVAKTVVNDYPKDYAKFQPYTFGGYPEMMLKLAHASHHKKHEEKVKDEL